jgi:hypothetical protein
MKTRFTTLFCTALLCRTAFGQNNLTINFDGPPPQAPGTSTLISSYTESGVLFTNLSQKFGRAGGGISGLPEDGSAYLQTGSGSAGGPISFSFLNGSHFSLLSVDLAEYSTVVAGHPVTFLGIRGDGSLVTNTFNLDGVIDGTGPLADFQTFSFSSEFTDLVQVDIRSQTFSMDNVLVSVPEPSIACLVITGAVLIGLRRRQRRAG